MTIQKGLITTAIGTSNDYANAIIIQPDGKFVTAGYIFNGTNADFALVRYNNNGSLDNSFNNTGKVTTTIGNADDIGTSLVMQSDNKFIVAGYSNNGTNNDFSLARYNSNGSLDTSFGTNGKVMTAIGAASDNAYSIKLQSDNKIVVAGYAHNGVNNDFALVRYNSDGSLDTSFGTNGKVITAVGNANDFAFFVTIQTDGKLIAVGRSSNGSNDDIAVVRYNSDGSLDNTFGTNGKVTTAIGNLNDYARFALIADNKLIVIGYSNNGVNTDFAIVRYNSDGSLDTTFGNAGKVITDFNGLNDTAISAVIQSDNKLVLAGYSSNGANSDFALARYNSDGSLDTSFGTNGKVMTDFNAANDLIQSIVIQADGKLVVTGSSWNGANDDIAIARYNSDGSLDSTFDTVSVAVLNHAPTGAVSIDDITPEQNQVLTASNTLIDADGLGTITYSWLVNNVNVATGNTYTVSSNDVGKKINIIANYTDALGHAESVSSVLTSAVTLPKLVLNGSAIDDLLVGDTGNDLINGNAGNDLLDGDAGNDTINGGDGNDLIHGDIGNDSLTGGNGADLIYGGAGNDIINGSAGNDVLRGGLGLDNFIFNTALTIAGIDKISDFKVIDDTIKLENAIFTKLTVVGVLNSSNVIIGSSAVDTNDFIIYNNNTGALYYDADGSGAVNTAVQIATLGVNLAITNADFVII